MAAKAAAVTQAVQSAFVVDPAPPPIYRRLRGYTFDPSLSTRLDTAVVNETTYYVDWEAKLEKGPVGEYLEVMESDDLVAMIPVHRQTAGDRHWDFPYGQLWDRLKVKAKGRVLLADGDLDVEKLTDARSALSDEEWKRFKKRTKLEQLYVEHRIPC